MPQDPDPLTILLVEDNAGDVLLVQEALAERPVAHELHVTRDGVAALDFLHRRNGHDGAPRPDVMILDLNLPRRNGREVMAHLAHSPELRSVPVAVFTSSHGEGGICDEFPQLRCIVETKTPSFSELIQVMSRIERFARQASGRDGRSAP